MTQGMLVLIMIGGLTLYLGLFCGIEALRGGYWYDGADLGVGILAAVGIVVGFVYLVVSTWSVPI